MTEMFLVRCWATMRRQNNLVCLVINYTNLWDLPKINIISATNIHLTGIRDLMIVMD